MKKEMLFICVIICAILCSTNIFAQDHLLLTEVGLNPNEAAFIEIYNATGATVDLTNYYLGDDDDYALTPGMFGAGPGPNMVENDFIVQFPNGTAINHRQAVIIAINGAAFLATFGFAADYEILGNDPGAPDMIPTVVSVNPKLNNGGENVCLFYWDGVSDLVADVDMVNIGSPNSENDIGNKTGVSVDGPDANTIATTYLDDVETMPLQNSNPGNNFSTKRALFEDGNELRPVGNGLTGHDETTENILITWDSVFVAPDPGVVGPGIPVELSSFTVSVIRNSVTVKWTTATELNNSGFDILRRVYPAVGGTQNGQLETIAFVEGNGTTTEAHNYSYVDDNLIAGKYAYRLKQLDFSGAFQYSNVVNAEIAKPLNFKLSQNHPNPFNPSTTINFQIHEAGLVSLIVYDILGNEIITLVNEKMEPGNYNVTYDASSTAGGLSSGTYIYQLRMGSFVETKKLILIK